MTSPAEPPAPLSRTDAKRLLIAATNDAFESFGFTRDKRKAFGLWHRPFSLPGRDMYQIAYFVTSRSTQSPFFALMFTIDAEPDARSSHALLDVGQLSTREEYEELYAFNESRPYFHELIESRVGRLPWGASPFLWLFRSEDDVLEAAAWIVPRLGELAQRHADQARERMGFMPPRRM